MRKYLLVVILAALVALPALSQVVQGTVTTTYNVVAPAKPAVALANLGAGAIEDGTRTYKVTAVDAVGESLPSVASAALVSVLATNGKATVILPALASGQVSWRVYREKAANGTWYLNDTSPFSSAVAPGTYTDNTADTALSATTAPTANTTGLAAPSANAVALANLGAGLITNGTHSWKITFLDAAGETLPSSSASSVLTTATATNGKVNVTIPAFAATATGANVYRTVAGDTGDYKLVNAVPIVAAGVYVDNIADGSLGAVAPTVNTTGIAQAATPVAALANLGAGAIEDGTRTYKFTAVNAGGESMAGTASSDVVFVQATNGKAVVTVPALAADQVSFRVYRNKAGGGTWFLNDTAPFSAAVAPGTYTDNTPDTALSATDAPGSDTTSPTVAPPSAAGAAVLADLGVGLVDDGTHSYKLQWIDAVGHSLESASACAPVTTVEATNGKVNVTVPALITGATACNIYRTAAGDIGDYKLVNATPLAPGVYVDNIADASLGAALTATNTSGIVQPSAPTAALANLGVGLITTGTHSWKQTWVDAVGSTIPSSASSILTTAETTNGKVNITIPAFLAGATGANLYRTVAGDTGDYKLVNVTPILAAGTYVDNIADASLGAVAPTLNTSGMAQPAAPSVALWNGGAGLCTTGSHLLKVAYVTASGISTLSVASDAVTTASTTNGKIVLTVVASANPSVDSVNLYMTHAAGSDYFLASSGVANTNGDVTVNVADASLTSAAPVTDTSGNDTVINATGLSGQYAIWLYNHDSSLPLYFSLNGATVSTTTSPWIKAGDTFSPPYMVSIAGGGVRVRSTTAGVAVSYMIAPK